MKIGKTRRFLFFVSSFVWFQASVTFCLLAEDPDDQQARLSGDLFRIYEDMEAETLRSQLGISSLPLVKKDQQGRLWKAWEEWGNEQSKIRLVQILPTRSGWRQVTGQQSGFNYSPDFSFDQNHSPWLIWVHYFNREYRIYVQDISSRRTWLLGSESRGTLASPKIILDQNNFVWAFWNATIGRKGSIFYRVYHQKEWSPLTVLPQENDWPPLNPDLTLDGHGNLWAVWSRYDGEDYEIYLSRWNGLTWLKEIQVTDNEENDGFPAIDLGPDDEPLLSWTQSSGRGNQICLISFKGGVFSQKVRISPPVSEMAISRIFRDGEKIGVVWKSADGIKTKELSPRLPAENESTPSPSPQPLFNPSLDENKYAGLGDSITYGYINRLPAPDLGYPPRLDIILKQNFGPNQMMINKGIGGEVTAVGLSRIDMVISTTGARYILIMEGTNDVITLSVSMETSAFNLSEMIRKCLKAGAFPAIATIIPRRDWLWAYDFIRERHLDLVEKIRQVAANFPVPLVDQYDLFLNYPSTEGGLESLLSQDLLHPSEKGYQFIAESWFDEIRNFPFPPVGLQLRGRNPQQNISLSPTRSPSSGVPPKNPTIPSGISSTAGNLLTWNDNPKIFDKTRIKAYKIYRIKPGVPNASFELLATVSGALRFFDSGAHIVDQFIYLITALRDDGVEGPASAPAGR